MSEADREKWESRYRAGSYESRGYPSAFLESWLARLPASLAGGRALDVACGAGRNALRLAQAGFEVDAVDISRSALERARASAAARGLRVSWMEADLDHAAPQRQAYALISVIRYGNRRALPRLAAALAPGGWILIEHHLQTSRSVGGPRDAAFRLAPQELLRAFPALRVVYYEEMVADDPDGRTMALARLAACNGDPGF